MSRHFLVLAILTLITIIAWTAIELYSSASTIQLSQEVIDNSSQTNYTFFSDTKFLNDNFSKNVTIRYTRDQLNGQK